MSIARPASISSSPKSQAFQGPPAWTSRLNPARPSSSSARMSERKSAVIATSSAGLLGYGLTLAATSGYKNQGPMDFLPLDETAARTTIAELRLVE